MTFCNPNCEALAARLGRHPVFAALEADECRAIVRAGKVRRLRRDEPLFSMGEFADVLAFVVSGRIDVVRHCVDGTKVLLHQFVENTPIGVSSVAGASHSADTIAAVPSDVLMIPGRAVRSILARCPRFGLDMVKHMAGLLARLTDDLEALRAPALVDRVWSRLERLGRGRREVRITHAELAAQVGGARANVSRALAELERRGWLYRHRGRIELYGSRKPISDKRLCAF